MNDKYDRMDCSEGIDANKVNASKKCDICHDWYFLNIAFKFEPYVCNRCHGLMQIAIYFNDVVLIAVKRSDYRTHFWYMSKDDAINIMKNSDLNEKKWIVNFFFIIYKNKWQSYLLLKK